MFLKFMSEETSEKIEKTMRKYQIERAKTLYSVGYSVTEISEILGIPESMVRIIRSE